MYSLYICLHYISYYFPFLLVMGIHLVLRNKKNDIVEHEPLPVTLEGDFTSVTLNQIL